MEYMKPDNQILVIFGASGDLTRRKLLPSLFEVFERDMLPEHFVILGVARTSFSDEEYRREQKENLKKFLKGELPEQAKLDQFLERVQYLTLNTDQWEEYHLLAERIAAIRKKEDIGDRILFYLAIPPRNYELVSAALGKCGLNTPVETGGWRRIIVEKPFGHDLATARLLNRHLVSIFREDDIYRIDHFLGKETVQNILVLRFANQIFESLWNRNYIDSVEIYALETLGVENRGKYYEGAGAFRDMVQNHLMQLMGFVAMEALPAFDAELMRDEVAKVFRSLHPLTADDVVRGQYVAGEIGGQVLPAYREEKGVAADSTTETYVAMRFYIDNWRWGGVPFYFYTGKRMGMSKSEINIHFKNVPHHLFSGMCSCSSCNQLVLKVDAPESISLRFGLKVPGSFFEVKHVSMDFAYGSLCNTYIATAYERLLLDAMQGDSTLYIRTDALELSWRFIEPILQQWKENPQEGLVYYPAGSEGPEERKRLLQRPAEECTL